MAERRVEPLAGITGDEKKIVIRPELFSGLVVYAPGGRLITKQYQVKIEPKVRAGVLTLRLSR
jgi:hypothetical protein